MMKKFVLNFVFIFLSILFADAQTLGDTPNTINHANRSFVGMWITNTAPRANLVGTPYLFNNWYSRNDIYAGEKIYHFDNINYNAQYERFESRISSDSVFVVDPQSVKEIVINNKKFRRYLDPINVRNTYMEVVCTIGDTEILKKYYTTIQEGAFNPMTQQKLTNDKIVIKAEYFVKEADDKISEVKLKKSSILKYIDDAQDQSNVKTYAKVNDLDFKDEDDLKRIMNYYDTL